ncbi:MAG TPA: hypothetical protein DCM28_13145 [Phycisphaerales bacterium]|nr:hypothetical protein [Phycisphaerales bacterium]HCD31635.1 hypothetical protein [Phycisphaerales bacterium]
MIQTAKMPKAVQVAIKVKSARCRPDVLIETIANILDENYGEEMRLREKINQLEASLETAQREYDLLKTHGSKS